MMNSGGHFGNSAQKKQTKKPIDQNLKNQHHSWHLDGMTIRQKKDYPSTKITNALEPYKHL